MAQATYAVTTSGSDLANLWRKVQIGIVVAAQFGVEEWNALLKAKNLDVNWSAREMTRELDLNRGFGGASIPEGGKEARPSTPTTVTATLTWIFLNKRFTISRTAQYIQQQQGMKGQLESQLKFQAKKALEAIRARVGDMFYGFSTGTACLINAAGGAPAYTLKDQYGVVGQGSTTHNRRCADMFEVGDYVAILNPVGPALRGIQKVTAIDRTTNTLTLDGSPAGVATGDLVTFANNLENTTLAGGTERSLWLSGLLDAVTSTSLHGVSGAQYPKWNSYADTAGGRFTGIRLRKMKQAIENNGGGTLNTVWWSNGVENDVLAQLQAGLRFSDAYQLEMDGAPKSKGVTFSTTRRVPDGYVFGYDKSASVERMTLLPEPGTPGFEDGFKLQDDSGLVFSVDYPCAMTYRNRANMAYASGLTQS